MPLAGLVLAALLASAPAGAGKAVLPFIEDDYPKALAEARAKNLPIFAEAWAPWCHTCRSMRAFVYTDKALAKYAGSTSGSRSTPRGRRTPPSRRSTRSRPGPRCT